MLGKIIKCVGIGGILFFLATPGLKAVDIDGDGDDDGSSMTFSAAVKQTSTTFKAIFPHPKPNDLKITYEEWRIANTYALETIWTYFVTNWYALSTEVSQEELWFAVYAALVK